LSSLPIVAPFWSYVEHCTNCGLATKIVMSLQSVLSLTWLGLSFLAFRRKTDMPEKPRRPQLNLGYDSRYS
jgi:hypothetical protein